MVHEANITECTGFFSCTSYVLALFTVHLFTFCFFWNLGRGLLHHSAARVDPALVDGVEVPLVEVDEEDDVIPEAGDPVRCRHGDDKGEQVVDEGVERLVHEGPPGEVRHRFELMGIGNRFYDPEKLLV